MNKNLEPVITAEKLFLSFGSKFCALNNLNISVPRGGVYGFLGRNGSGKTTAIKVFAGLLRPGLGTVRVLGKNPFEFTPEDRQRVGYMSEKQILPVNYRVGALAAFCAHFYPRWDGELARQLFSRFGINPRRKIKTLSNGTQRQVAFILALAPRPELLLLDEPASTLDVVARREFLGEILELIRGGDSTVFISSHILSDIERVADHIGILVDGALAVSEPLDDLAESVKRIRFHSFVRRPEKFTFPGAFRVAHGRDEILVTARVPRPEELRQFALQVGANYEIQNLNLEDIFCEVSSR